MNFPQEIAARDLCSVLSLLAPQYLYSGPRNQRSAWSLLTQDTQGRQGWMEERLTFPPSGLCFQSIPERKLCLPKEATRSIQQVLEGTVWRENGAAKAWSPQQRKPQNQKSWRVVEERGYTCFALLSKARGQMTLGGITWRVWPTRPSLPGTFQLWKLKVPAPQKVT